MPKGEGRGEGEVVVQISGPAHFEMSAAFPLILTFSLGEKEQQLDMSAFAKAIRAAD
jgi:hypothetical protein